MTIKQIAERPAAESSFQKPPEATPPTGAKQPSLFEKELASLVRDQNFTAAMAEREIQGLTDHLESLEGSLDTLSDKVGQLSDSIDALKTHLESQVRRQVEDQVSDLLENRDG